MTLYIACESDSGARVVRLEGWLEGEAVAELERGDRLRMSFVLPVLL